MHAARPIAAATLLLAAILAASASRAQSDTGPILTGRNLNEASVIEALAPGGDVRTRSIRVRPSSTPGQPARTESGAASVLVTFDTDSADIRPASRQMLDVVGRALNSERLATLRFAVEGHADPRGGHTYNLRLSQARADSVVDYLVNNHGVARERLAPLGKGDFELANPRTPTAPENRRVTFRTKAE